MSQDDLKDQQRKQGVVDAKRVRAFQDMVGSDGWKLYIDILEKNFHEKMQVLLTRPTDASPRGEDFDKGVCYGLLWAKDLPETTIKAFKEQNSTAETDEENEQ